MRIWHQSFTVLQNLGAYDDALRAHFKRVARPDTEIVMHGMHPGTYPSTYPGDDIRHAPVLHLHGMQFVAAGLKAQDEGFDAYAISTLPDPWLREIRAMLDIPVVGYGESAMLASCMLGRRFGILGFIPELATQLEENVRLYGLQDRFAGAHDVGFRFNDVLAGFADPAPLLERFRKAARGLIAAGADVIIPGEAPMCVLLASQRLSQVDGVPVMDSLSAWIKCAEMTVDLKKQSGVSVSRRGYYQEPPKADRMREIAAFYGLDKLPQPGR